MSAEAWIAIAGILVSIVVAGATLVFGIVGWFLSRMIAEQDGEIEDLKSENECLQKSRERLDRRLTVIETVLRERKILDK